MIPTHSPWPVAALQEDWSADLPPHEIYGGMESEMCAWPTAVALDNGCSGTLIHPQIVLFAAHCGDEATEIFFGESVAQPARTLDAAWCAAFPEGEPGTGLDFAICLIAEPQTDIAIVAPALGCELESVRPGDLITLVGFGADEDGTFGQKREVEAPLVSISSQGVARIGGDGKDTCTGDSGGPAFVRLSSSTPDTPHWRLLAVTSDGGACGSGGNYSLAANGVAWIEATSGMDISPCHTAFGAWDPTPRCAEGSPFNLEEGAWTSGCTTAAPLVPSLTCGSAYDPQPDATPPSVSLLSPLDDAEFEIEDENQFAHIPITVLASDEESDIADVQLVVDALPSTLTHREVPPFEFVIDVVEGEHEIVAIAIDSAGNAAMAPGATIVVTSVSDARGCSCASASHELFLVAPLALIAALSIVRRSARPNRARGPQVIISRS